MIRNKAFTLAEVLITLGVIGVVSAMTLPTVIKNYQKQVTVNKLKKVYTVLNQAIKLSEIENSEYEYWEKASDIGANAYFEKYFKPYLKTAKLCNSNCGYDSNKPWTHSTMAIYDGTETRIPMVLADGTVMSILAKSNQSDIIIDINGIKNPNDFGKDTFLFTRTKNGILPRCYEKLDDYIKKNCNSTARMCCTRKIMQDGWKISDDYPW